MNNLIISTAIRKQKTITEILERAEDGIKNYTDVGRGMVTTFHLYREDYDKLDKWILKESKKAQSLATHLYKGVLLKRGNPRKQRRRKSESLNIPFSQQGAKT